MIDFLIIFFVTLVVFFLIDMLWLGIIAKSLYQKYLGEWLSKDVRWAAAFIFYGLFIVGISFFVILPALERESALYALGVGALFGLITYSTYDLTNLATLKFWPIEITIIDLIWGTFLGGFTSFISYFIVSSIL